MPAPRLCRLLASYLFDLSPAAAGHPSSSTSSFDAAHELFCAAGDALEGVLRASLAEQTDLPARLAELLHPEERRPDVQDRTVRVLRVELETRGEWDPVEVGGTGRVNDQETGRAAHASAAEWQGQGQGWGGGGRGGTPARRMPLDVLRDALEQEGIAAGEDDAAARAWEALRRCAAEKEKEGDANAGAEALLDGEVVRVLDLVGLGPAAGDPSTDAPFALLGGARGRTQSHAAAASGARGNGALGLLAGRPASRSTGNLLSPAQQQQQQPASWDLFASSGFAPSPADTELDLLSPAQLLHRAEALAAAARRARPKPFARLVALRIDAVDEAFADLWLDSLDETRSTASPCAAWPSVVLAPLERGVAAQLGGGEAGADAPPRHLLVVEVLLPLEGRRPAPHHPSTLLAPPPALARAGSSASPRDRDGAGGFPGGKWRRRASAIFSHSGTGTGTGAGPTPVGTGQDNALAPQPTSPRRGRMSLGRPAAPLSSSSARSRADLPPAIPAVPPSNAAADSGPGPASPGVDASPSRPGGFVRSISQGFASARRKTSRQSMYGGGAALASPVEDKEVQPVPAQRWEGRTLPSSPGAGEGEGADEVRGYDVATPEGSPVLARSSSASGRDEQLLAPQQSDRHVGGMNGAREGAPPLGRVAVPSPVMEEQELFEGQPPAMQRSVRLPCLGTFSPLALADDILCPCPQASVDPLSGSPNLLDCEPLAPQHGAPFGNLAEVEPVVSTEAGPLAAVGVPQLERAAAADEPESVVGLDEGAQEGHEASGSDEAAQPLPQLPETADLPAPTSAEELVAPPYATTEIAQPPCEPAAQVHEEQTATDPSGETLAVEQPETVEPATPTSPLVTLSLPPDDEAKALPSVPLDEGEHVRVAEEPAESLRDEQEVQRTFPSLVSSSSATHAQYPAASPGASIVGLGLVGAPAALIEPEPAAPATPTKGATIASPSRDLNTPSSVAMGKTLSAESARSRDSRTAPKSPTPSRGSTSSTGSRKFLASVGGFLKRKKSTVSKEQARRDKDAAEAAAREEREAKELRKLREEELRREVRERKAPTPVSNVKARVREIEEEEAAVGASAVVPTSPTTPSRVRTASGGPRPATPTRSLARPGSVLSLRSAAAAKTGAPELPLPPIPAPAPVENGSNEVAVAEPEPAAVSATVAGGPAGPSVDDSVTLSTVDEPTLVSSVETAPESDHTGVIGVAPVVSPAQESQHLHIKAPGALDELASPLPSPTPHTAETGEPALLADGEDLTAPLPDVAPPVSALATGQDPVSVADVETLLADPDEAHAAVIPSIDISSPAPTPQTPEHLHVKVPSALEDLPSPVPSPTPGAEAHDGEVDALVDEEDTTEVIPEVKAPVFAPEGDKAGEGEEAAAVPHAVEGGDVAPADEQVEAASEGTAEPVELNGEHFDTNGVSVEPHEGHTQEASGEMIINSGEPTPLDEQVSAPATEPPRSPREHEPPTTPSKTALSHVTNGTPLAHATPVAPLGDDVFSASPSAAVDATPTKPSAPLPPLLRQSTSQYSLSTTRSFQTADSSAQSSATEGEWEPAASREAF